MQPGNLISGNISWCPLTLPGIERYNQILPQNGQGANSLMVSSSEAQSPGLQCGDKLEQQAPSASSKAE